MTDPSIIIPGALPTQKAAPSDNPVGELKFGVNGDQAVQFQPVYALKGQDARDALIGNPAYHPYLVMIPYITSKFDIDPDMRHDLAFVRGKQHDPIGSGLGAVSFWDQLVSRQHHGPAAESCGQPMVLRLDEGDALEIWKDAVRFYNQDKHGRSLVAIGDPLVPFFFCVPGETFSFNHLKRFENAPVTRRRESGGAIQL